MPHVTCDREKFWTKCTFLFFYIYRRFLMLKTDNTINQIQMLKNVWRPSSRFISGHKAKIFSHSLSYKLQNGIGYLLRLISYNLMVLKISEFQIFDLKKSLRNFWIKCHPRHMKLNRQNYLVQRGFDFTWLSVLLENAADLLIKGIWIYFSLN